MRSENEINKPEIIIDQEVKKTTERENNAFDLATAIPVIDLSWVEGNEDFYNYISWLGLAKEPGLLVLSPEHHYFYDVDDLKNIKTVVNMMPLNRISNLKNFLATIFNLVPHRCCFTGCFTDKNQNLLASYGIQERDTEKIDNGILSRIPLINIIYNLLDMRTNIYLSKKNVTFMLESQGFRVIDMTELNRMIYFCAKKPGTNDI